jgi:hypothetical protein
MQAAAPSPNSAVATMFGREFDGDEKYDGARTVLRHARGDAKARNAGRAAEAEDRHTLYIGAEAHLAREPCIQARRCNAGRRHRDDAIDLLGSQTGTCQRVGSGFPEELACDLGVGFHAVLPAMRLFEPGKRTGDITLADAGAFEHAGEMLELAKTIGKQTAGGLGSLRLVDDVVGRGDSQTDKLDGIGHLFLLATLGGYVCGNTRVSGIIRVVSVTKE